MANKKNIDEFERELQNDIVRKTPTLLRSSVESWGLDEYKVCDAFLAQYDFDNCRDENGDYKPLTFSVGELEFIVGASRLTKEQFTMLRDKLPSARSLFQVDNVVFNFGYFDRTAEITGKRNAKYLSLIPSRSLVEIMQAIGQPRIQFYKYRRNLTNRLSSFYGYQLANYIICESFKNTWDVPLADLIDIVGCTGIYREEKYFVSRILKKHVAEMNQFDDQIHIAYQIDRGSKKSSMRTTVHFTVEKGEYFAKAPSSSYVMSDEAKQEMEEDLDDSVKNMLNNPFKQAAQKALEMDQTDDTEKPASPADMIHEVFSPEEINLLSDFIKSQVPGIDDGKIDMKLVGAAIAVKNERTSDDQKMDVALKVIKDRIYQKHENA